MKTLNSISKIGNEINFLPKLILLASILLCLSLPKTSFGQTPACNYLINNGSACSIKFDVEYYDAGGLCNTVSGIGLNSGSQYYANCGSCSTLVDIKVTVTQIGGTATSGFFVDSGNPNDSDPLCSTVYMDWQPNSTDLHN